MSGRLLRDAPAMAVGGVVRVWHEDEGWGVIDSPETPDGCWAHFSSVLMPGYRALHAGESVTLDYEPAEQDGYAFRATDVWPAGQAPDRAEVADGGTSSALESTLTITFDAAEGPDRVERPD